jgi:hypothetical protein
LFHRSENRVQFSDLVGKRKIPPGGITEMTAIIRKDISFWSTQSFASLDITRGLYKRYCSFMFAAFYILTPQGRIGGFEELKFKQIDALYDEGSIYSSTFKTGAKFGFQAFSTSTETKPLVQCYVNNLRPIAVNRGKLTSLRSFKSLWLDYDGKSLAASNIGRLVTSYWKCKTATTTSTTICRALVETAAHKACQEGDISTSQRDAINGINGHSGQIAQDYYLFHDRKREVSLAVEGFKKIIGEPEMNQQEGYEGVVNDSEDNENKSIHDNTDEAADPWNEDNENKSIHDNTDEAADPWNGFETFLHSTKPDTVLNSWNGFGEFLQNSKSTVSVQRQSMLISPPKQPNQWLMDQVKLDTHGLALSTPPAKIVSSPLSMTNRNEQFGNDHPSIQSDTKRVQFSPFEIKYVGEFCAKLVRESPYLCTRMFAECLEAIRTDASVHPHFHPRHVESSDRLRPALLLWERVNGKVVV